MFEEFRNVGKNVPRLDALEKATGVAKYAGDMRQYGMLYGKILRSPYAHAKVASVDTSKAEKLEGVKAILTLQDIPLTWFGESGVADAQVLPDRVRFWGDEVLAVAAESEEIAERALELIDVEYEKLQMVLSPEEALKPGAPLIPPPGFSQSNLLEKPSRTFTQERGNVEEGFKEADCVVEGNYRTAFVQHMSIETRACLVRWDNDILDIHVNSHTPFMCKTMIAKVIGMPESKVRLVAPYIGGTFGGNRAARFTLIAALLAKKTSTSVKVMLTREENILTKLRPASIMQVRMGFKRDGSFVAIDGSYTADSGGYSWSYATEAVLPVHCLFRSPSMRCRTYSVYTNHPYTGHMRGVANVPMTFAICQLTDEASEELGLDPVEFIKKTHIKVGDECNGFWEREGVTLSSCGLDECLERGAETIGWREKWKGHKTPVEVKGCKKIGIGVAPVVHLSGLGSSVSGAVVKLNSDGSADFLLPAGEIGQGSKTTQAQILSEASGIPLEKIHVVQADTEACPFYMGTIASGTAHITGLATKLAGQDAKQQFFERAAEEWKVDPEELDIENGKIYSKINPKKAITIEELMVKMYVGGVPPVVGRGAATCPSWPQKARDFGAHFAEVEVDTETGKVKVLRYVVAHDVGRALNPMIVEGQIEGGVVMGLGMSLTEECIFDGDGKLLNPGFTDYKIFTSADCPEIIPIIVESKDPLGPYGVKGFAETTGVPVPACIANAIYNAIGIRFKELPITPEKVLKMYRDRSI